METKQTKQSTSGGQQNFENMRQQLTDQYVAPAIDSMREVLADRPMSAVMTAFGAGFAVGIMLAASLATAAPSRRRNRSTMQRLGEQVLEAVTNVLPQSIAHQINR